jgi:hypothetical protein
MIDHDQATSIFKTAQNFLGHGENWTVGAYARNSEGKPVDFDSPSAVSFDTYGAILRAVSCSSLYPSERVYFFMVLSEVSFALGGITKVQDQIRSEVEFLNFFRNLKQTFFLFCLKEAEPRANVDITRSDISKGTILPVAPCLHPELMPPEPRTFGGGKIDSHTPWIAGLMLRVR